VLRSQLAPGPESYEWLFELLVGRTSTVSWAAAGELPAAFDQAEQFAVLPAGAGRSFMVSLGARPGTVSALTSYNALRSPRRRLARSVLALGLRAGLAQPLLAHRIDVGTAAGATREQLAKSLLSEHLRRLFGAADIVVAFGGTSGPYRKPVLQVFGGDGSPLGYVKVGWNDWTRSAIRCEAAALRACAGSRIHLGVPALLDQCQWRGLDLLVTAPLPAGVRRLGGTRLPPASLLREITELSPVHDSPLAASQWWRGLRDRIETGVADHGSRTLLAGAADLIENSDGDTRLRFGRWHGDLVPWNLARLGSRIYAWDWESSSPAAPVGFDALHFPFQIAFIQRQRPLGQAAALAAEQATPALTALGVGASVHGLLSRLHLLELAVRHEEAHTSTGDRDGRFYPDVTRVLGRANPTSAARAS
jgi:hypothetical protein